MSQETKTPALNRIIGLLDGNSFVEIGGYVTARNTDFNMANQETPRDGVYTGYGTIDGRLVYVYSQDASVLGGSIGEMHAKKIANIYTQAVKMGAPIIGFIDCAGLRLQEATDTLDGFGKLYLAQTIASGVVPQIQAIFGSCGGGLAISSALSDFTFMESQKAKLFVNSPNAILGNHVDKLDTASADYKTKEAGWVDMMGTEEEVLSGIRNLVMILPDNHEDNASYAECLDDLNREVDILGCSGDSGLALTHISDNHFFYELKKSYACEMLTGFIRLNGQTIGCVANRSKIFASDLSIEAEFDKSLTAKGARKASRFIEFCDAFQIPILAWVDVNGFANCSCSEKYLAKDVAKLTYAFANATVPKVTLITEEAIGSAYLSMNSKSIGADIVYAWEDARIGMMDSKAAVQIIYAKEISQTENKLEFIAEKSDAYEQLQSSAISAARRGYVDDIIDSRETRKRLIAAFEMLFTKKEERIAKKHGTV